MFSELKRVTLVAILLYDTNDSDLHFLCSDIISENSREMLVLILYADLLSP